MEKKIAGLLGAAAALGTLNAAQAATEPAPQPSDVLRANSYADLLAPIPNAAKVLRAMDDAQARDVPPAAREKVAQWYHHHHHHHHHHHGYWGGGPVVVVPPRAYYYHHHHHHHWYHHHHHHHHGWYRYDRY
jgi:hypothetical protein